MSDKDFPICDLMECKVGVRWLVNLLANTFTRRFSREYKTHNVITKLQLTIAKRVNDSRALLIHPRARLVILIIRLGGSLPQHPILPGIVLLPIILRFLGA